MFYDGCYNPTYYRTFIFEWNNIRQLTWCRNTDGNALKDTTFAYGSDGIRCRKNNIYYTLDGNRILKEYNQDTGKTITYLYGEKGIVGFNYNGNDYYYRKDIHGDVLAIYDTNGNVVATYKYDAWGKNLPLVGDETNEIKKVNPIRYRSYYYDTETGFYYLESRYYDPEIGRFLNADSLDYLGNGEDLKNYNLFAYCGNNPVMYSDPTGHIPFFILSALVLGSVGAIAGGLIAHNTDNNVWAGIGIGFAIGAVVGAAAGIALSYYATGSLTSSTGKVFSGLFGKSTFYRSMTVDDYSSLSSTGKVSPGTETFISPSANYASGYNGLTVQFTVRNRTVNWLTKIGVRDTSTLVSSVYPNMQTVSKGWMAKNAYFKAEGAVINIGLGYGKALDIFNKGILSFLVL